MARLEEITPGALVTGLAAGGPAEVVAVRRFGPDALEVTYKVDGRVLQSVVYRDDEPRLSLQGGARRFALDADGGDFKLALEALRIRLAHLFDPFLALRSSQIDPLPHQLTAVYDVMLKRQPLRFLLADDPGAGKTIMAGLLIKELMIRGDVERCLVVAPGSLVEQWQDELNEKFGLHFDILTRAAVESAVTGNPFAERNLLIARLDMLARAEDLQQRLKGAPEWDLVVCDEAHRMSATYFGGEVKYTKRYHLGQLVGERTRHLLLMTATPHNGKEEDFQLFLGLLDADRFEGRAREGARRIDASDLMRRLTKEELRRFDGRPLFPERRAYTVSYALSDDEAALYEAVTQYVREEMNRADQLEGDERRRANVGFALQILQRRLASSPAAIHESLKRRIKRLEDRLEEERLLSRGGQVRTRARDTDLPEWDEEDLEEAPDEEIEEIEAEVVDRATAARTIAELEAEIAFLKRIERLAARIRRSRQDTKWRQLEQILDDPLVYDPKRDIRRKLVIFTEFRDTLTYLAERIRERTGDPESVVVIHGGIPRDTRRAAIAAFNDDPRVRFLVANDAAGEGVNLQRGAHLMVNYDLPWNPNRLEQRFGRIHRIGQTEVCHLWNLVAGETREGQVYKRLLEKIEAARAALGGKVYDVLGELFEARALRELFMEAIRYGERPEVRAKLEQKIEGDLDTERIQRIVERNKLTRDGLDPATITALKEELDRAEAQRLQPGYIRSFFLEAFGRLGGVLHAREKGRFEVTHVPASLRERDRLIGRGDPVLKRYDRICFDKADVAGPRGARQAVLVAPGHPLLDATIDLTLERLRTTLQAGTILIDDDDRLPEPRLLVCLEHGIHDGRTTPRGQPRLISQRLQFVYIDRKGGAFAAGPAPYLDYRPATEDERARLADLLAQPWLAAGIEDAARAYAIQHLVPRHLDEVSSRRLREIERVERAVKERLTQEILYWQHRHVELLREEQTGGRPRLNSEHARQRMERLQDRLQRRLAELEKERQITALPPEIQGAALIVPRSLLNGGGDSEGAKPFGARDAESRRRIEQLAMKAVMDAERALGRQPRDVSADNRGYDIESHDPETGRLVFIEVKGRVDNADAITLTRNEMMTAFNALDAGLSYVLAIVPVEDGFAHQPVYVRDPARLFGAEPGFVEVARSFKMAEVLRMGGPPA